MHNQEPPALAAIDIGSNTIHIVVAQCFPTSLKILLDEQEMVRIGSSVTATGSISTQKLDTTISVLSHYQKLAAHYTSLPILVVATEAIRKAHNRAQFLAAIHTATNLDVHLIDGSVEAILTFYGATYELFQEPSPPEQITVLDLGGGSMELVTATNQQITWHTSVPLGSGWLHDRYLQADPPSQEDLEVARTFLTTYIAGLHFKQHPPALIATGGSANSLLLLAQNAFDLPTHTTSLTYEQIVRCESLLSNLTAEEVSQRYKQPLKRATVLPAGALIIDTLMLHLHLSEMRISSHGIREGALLAYARYGEQWLQRLQENAQPSSERETETLVTPENVPEETFAQSGRQLLLERTHRMLEWRSEVLKHEDSEAVHKMRVASRRLRAVLDAYEMACDAKKFKKVYLQVKEIADILGKARDTDVMVANLQQQLTQTPDEAKAGLQWLIQRLSTYRQAHQVILEAFLQKLDADAFVQLLLSCLPEGEKKHGKS
jgi:exopolyphosphatase/pppGpp-phosphohydrolase